MERWTRVLAVVAILGLIALSIGAAVAIGRPSAPAQLAGPRSITEPGVQAAVALTSASLSITPGSVDLGQSISVVTTPNGGTAPYTVHYVGIPSGCTVDTALSFQCSPSETGSFSVYANVTDTNGNQTNSDTLSLMVDSAVQVSLSISPSTITEGSSVSVSTSASGGSGGYSYAYQGLPSGCQQYNSASFSCTPSSTGDYNIGVNVTDSNGGYAVSNSQNLQINQANSGGNGSNGNGNGNSNSGGNNSSNPFSGLLSGFSGLLSLLFIVGIIGFVTWILLIVGVWVVAVVLIRRLPKPGVAAASPTSLVKCPSCSAMIPGGTKFCPECGAGTSPKPK